MRLAGYSPGVLLVCACAVVIPVAQGASAAISVESQNLRVEFDSSMHSRVVAKFLGKAIPVGEFGASEYVVKENGVPVQDFSLLGQNRALGKNGKRCGTNAAAGSALPSPEPPAGCKRPWSSRYTTRSRGWPSFKCTTRISRIAPLRVTGWTNNRYSIDAAGAGASRPSGRIKAARTAIVPTGYCR